MGHSFPKFARELELHAAPGYHRSSGPVSRAAALGALGRLGITPSEPYLQFLEEFGPGRYFDSSLVVYEFFQDINSIEVCSRDFEESVLAELFPVGYDGTTEGCYCLDRSARDGRVFWYRWGSDGVAVEAERFVDWVESLPGELFNPKIYRGYGPVRDPDRIARVVEDRAAIGVRLLEFDKTLVVAPGKDHSSPRYNRVVVGVTKRRPVDIEKLTVAVLREGSRHGDRNVMYLTYDISSVPVGVETPVTGYSFDAFSSPFELGKIRYEPAIDLSSKMRTCFAEIVDSL